MDKRTSIPDYLESLFWLGGAALLLSYALLYCLIAYCASENTAGSIFGIVSPRIYAFSFMVSALNFRAWKCFCLYCTTRVVVQSQGEEQHRPLSQLIRFVIYKTAAVLCFIQFLYHYQQHEAAAFAIGFSAYLIAGIFLLIICKNQVQERLCCKEGIVRAGQES